MENSRRMVLFKNMVNGTVCLLKPELGIIRKWQKFGQTMGLPFDLVEQLLWDNGFRNLIEDGTLYIENMQDKIDLGLEPDGATAPENIIVLDETKMANMWDNQPITVFKAEVSNLPDTQVQNLIEYAIEHDKVNDEKCLYLKELTKRDILVAISRKQDDIAEDLKAKEREEKNKNSEEGRRR